MLVKLNLKKSFNQTVPEQLGIHLGEAMNYNS